MTEPKPKPKRRTRIASDTAHSWARNLRLRNPHAKLVLMMLTGHVSYVNEICSCYVGIETLSEDTELSTDTVRKRLAWLEKIGAIARFPQWIDENGHRNGNGPNGSEGRGRRTSDDIRLLLEADQDTIEARASGDFGPENDSETTTSDHSPQQGLNPSGESEPAPISPSTEQGSNPVISEGQNTPDPVLTPPLALCRPSDSGKGLDSSEPESSNLKDSPQSPSLPDDKAFDLQWEHFTKNYPIPIADIPLTQSLLRALSDQDRITVITFAVPGYRKFVADEDRRAMDAHRFIRDGKWQGYVDLGKEIAPKPKAPPRPECWIVEGSVEFRALCVACVIARRQPPHPMPPVGAGPWVGEGKRSVRFVGDIPTGAETFAALFGVGNLMIAESGTQQFHAWRARVGEWIGQNPEAYRIWLDKEGNVVERADLAYREPRDNQPEKWWIPKCKEGLLVPRTETGFPPPKGTGTGPPKPQSLACESDLDPPFSKTG